MQNLDEQKHLRLIILLLIIEKVLIFKIHPKGTQVRTIQC